MQLNDLKETHLKVFPNLVTTDATIEISLSQKSKVHLTLANAIGQSIDLLTETMERGSHTIALPTATISKGAYFLILTMQTNTGTDVVRFVKD